MLATATERTVIQELGLYPSFGHKLEVPPVRTLEELEFIMERSRIFTKKGGISSALQEIGSMNNGRVGVGIKSVLLAIEIAKQDAENPAGRFARTMKDMQAEIFDY